MITEDFVSFNVAKLLKEKGFDEGCNSYFISDNEIALISNRRDFNNHGIYLSAPTHQMAMKWLRGKSIFIQIGIVEYSTITIPEKYYFFKVYIDRKFISHDKFDTYYTYEEAVEAACIYALKNLL